MRPALRLRRRHVTRARNDAEGRPTRSASPGMPGIEERASRLQYASFVRSSTFEPQTDTLSQIVRCQQRPASCSPASHAHSLHSASRAKSRRAPRRSGAVRAGRPRGGDCESTLLVGALMAAFFAVRASYLTFASQWIFCLALGVVLANGREMASSGFACAAHVIAKFSYGPWHCVWLAACRRARILLWSACRAARMT